MTLILAVAFVAGVPALLHAQCPDGAPPPCAATRRATARRAPPPDAQRARQYLLLPFRNVTQAQAQEWLVTGAPLMLADGLGQIRELRVVSDAELSAARRRLGIADGTVPDATQLRRLAEETGGWTAVTGNIVATGGRLRLSAQATDALNGRVLSRADADVAADADVMPAFDRLGARLLEASGLPPAAADLASLTTRSLDAYRAYARGMALLNVSAYRRATEAFREATRLDSTFAMAWARLAFTSAAWNVEAVVDPRSGAYAAAERAMAQSSRLPPRQAQLVRALSATFRGQFVLAHALIDTLAAGDAPDLDALEVGALLDVWDPSMDTTVTPGVRRASLNRGVTMARTVLERDPGRRHVYASLALPYALGGGLWMASLPGTRRSATSFAGALMASNEGFVPVLRDTFVTMRETDFEQLPEDERRRLRRRTADAGAAWVQRWLTAGPADGEAHLWASRFLQLQDSLPQALREATIADSLGVESDLESVRGRRVMLMMRLGRFAEAGQLADTLAAAGAYDRRAFATSFDNSRAFGLAALLITARLDRVRAVAVAAGRIANIQPACRMLNDLPVYGTRNSLPDSTAARIADTLAAYTARVVADTVLAPCIASFQSLTENRHRVVAGNRLAVTAESLSAAGSIELGILAAGAAFTADSTLGPRLARLENLVARRRLVELPRRLRPQPVIVEGDSVVVSWDVEGAEPLRWDFPTMRSSWGVWVWLKPGPGPEDERYMVNAWHTWRRRGQPAQGGITEAADSLEHEVYSSHRPPPVLESRVTHRSEGSRLTLVVHGGLAEALRRTRPPSGEVGFSPCAPWAAETFSCADLPVPIEYRPAR